MRTFAPGLIAAAWFLAGAPLAAPQDDPRSADQVKRVKEKLGTMRITLDFTGTNLDDVIQYVQEFSGLNFHIDSDLRSKLAEDQLKVTIKLKDVLLKSALKLILAPRDLGCTFRDGVLFITGKDKIAAAVATRVYDVKDLLFIIRDFAGPRVELMTPGGAGAALAGATFQLEEEPKTAVTEEFIIDLVKGNTGEKSWDDNSSASITLMNGLLVVSQSKKVHEEVRRLLDLLREFK